MKRSLASLTLLLLSACQPSPHETQPPAPPSAAVTVADPWLRATPPGAPVAGGEALVADAGFDEFVRQHWDALMAGEAVPLHFAVPSRLESLGFRIRRVGNLGNIPTFEPAVGVFIDFTISQTGMIRHWLRERSPGWQRRLERQAPRHGGRRPLAAGPHQGPP